MTENEYTNEQMIDFMYDVMDWNDAEDEPIIYEIIEALKEREQYRAIGTIEEFKALKEKENEDFKLLLKAVKESYPMSKSAYVELDVFMGDVMRRFARDRKEKIWNI